MSYYIPTHILYDILKPLPIQTLMRFRCVCKSWKQYIDSHSFTLDHLALQNPKFMLEGEDEELLTLDLQKLPLYDTFNPPIDDEFKHLHLVGTLHGIVCLYHDFLKLFFFWNPALHKFSFRCLPEPIAQFDWLYDGYPSSDPTCAAFWIDPLTYVVKVVAFTLDPFHDSEANLYGIFYSSMMTDWKRISLNEIQGYYYNVIATPPVMIQDVANWVAQYEFVDEQDNTRFGVVVVSFDFVQETFDIIEAYSVAQDVQCPVLCCNEDELSLLYIYPNRRCDIYSRKEDKWVLMFGIDLIPDISRVLWGVVEVEEVEVEETEKEETKKGETTEKETRKKEIRKSSMILATRGDELVLFETKTMSYRTLKKDIKDRTAFAMTYGYVESLLYVS